MSVFDPKNEDEERFKNLLFYKMYVTDKEMDEIAPWLVGTVVVLVIAFMVMAYLTKP